MSPRKLGTTKFQISQVNNITVWVLPEFFAPLDRNV